MISGSLVCIYLPHHETTPQQRQTRSRLIVGEHGPSDSALAAASAWQFSHLAADRHAALGASRDLCSGVQPSTLYTSVDSDIAKIMSPAP